MRSEAQEPMPRGTKEIVRTLVGRVAAGPKLSHDHGSQCMSDDFYKKLLPTSWGLMVFCRACIAALIMQWQRARDVGGENFRPASDSPMASRVHLHEC